MRFSIDVPDELVEWLDQLAASGGKSRSATMVFCARYTRLALLGVQELLADDPQFIAAAAEFVQQPGVRQALGKVSDWTMEKVVAGQTLLGRHRPYKRSKLNDPALTSTDKLISSDITHETQGLQGGERESSDGSDSAAGTGACDVAGGCVEGDRDSAEHAD